MIIKAGTYRWNDVVDLSVFGNDAVDFPLSFETPSYTYGGTEFGSWSIFRINNEGITYVMSSEQNLSLLCYVDAETVDDTHWFSARALTGGLLPLGYGQIFTLTIDTEVDDDSGTWFTSNTTMLIEAGTYRWNDTLTVLPGHDEVNQVDMPISFYSVGIIPPSEGNTVIDIVPTLYTNIFFTQLVHTNGDRSLLMCYHGDQYNIEPSVYDYANSMWGVFFSGLENLGFTLNGDYSNINIITVTEDTYAPTNFGLWATSNWEKQGEEEETYTIGSGIYKFKNPLTRPSTDFSQEMSFAVVGSEQINEGARYRLMETGRDMYLDFINVDSDVGIAFYAFEETSNGNIGFLWDTQTIQVLEPIKASAVFNDWFGASTEKIVNPDTIKAKIQSLIAKANSTTGKSDTDLTSGVNSLIAGYGQGDTPAFDGTIEIDGKPATDQTDYYEEGYNDGYNAGIAEGGGNAGGGIADKVLAFVNSAYTKVKLDYDSYMPSGMFFLGLGTMGTAKSGILPECVTEIEENSIDVFNYERDSIYEGFKVYLLALPTVPPTLGYQECWHGVEDPPDFIYVPDESVEAYKTATNWAIAADNIYPMSEIKQTIWEDQS